MKGILGRKIGMTEKFTKDGKIIPVTVISVEPNTIMQVKTMATDGYEAIQLAVTDKKEKRATKAAIGHAKKANSAPKRFLKEIRVSDASNYELGSIVKADIFEAGEKIDVQGTSKGKGFTGVIKRHNQSEGPKTHGSRYHRRPGSMGTMRPMRVMKGKKLSGHMGAETTTVQNLTVIEIDTELNYILVSGNVPGAKNSLVLIKEAVKGGKKETFELVSYAEEVTCTCTDACASGSNPDCTCEHVDCHCRDAVEEVSEATTDEAAAEADCACCEACTGTPDCTCGCESCKCAEASEEVTETTDVPETEINEVTK